MKGPFHGKWYLQKTKARREALGVLANSLKKDFALAAKHQSVLLLIICIGSSPEKWANKPQWSQAQFLGGRRGGYSHADGSAWEQSVHPSPRGSSTSMGLTQALGLWKKGHLGALVSV